ncbi:MAG: glycosyltransferase family 2 protein [Coleofasciculus sp. D1-CHI-01]|uniref:glycosyltransferase family 2 protein n=1 Tax=Coleofasciculus sp. D1-CHI-01 TaxID=3068482 RepID=UPI003303E562
MSQPVDLLLITWNRREYVEKTLPNLLADPSDFRLYCWDNGSTDGTADLIASINDPRLVKRHFNPENAVQYQPCLWFFETATSDVIGKIDDDILLPEGWTKRIAPMIRKEPKFGMLGCWIFMPEDWNETLAQHNIVELSGERVFRCMGIQGQSFLARRDYLIRYQKKTRHGLPVARYAMSVDGLVNGYPVPLLYAHNMDDPRSPMNVKTKSGPLGLDSALSARNLKFDSAEAFGQWIAADALRRQTVPFDRQIQIKLAHLQCNKTRLGKIIFKLWERFCHSQIKHWILD